MTKFGNISWNLEIVKKMSMTKFIKTFSNVYPKADLRDIYKQIKTKK